MKILLMVGAAAKTAIDNMDLKSVEYEQALVFFIGYCVFIVWLIAFIASEFIRNKKNK